MLPRGFGALTDFHLPPHRALHCSASQTDGQDWEPGLGGRQTQGERGTGIGGQKPASAELWKGCVSLGNCVASPSLSHLHIQTAAVIEPEPALRVSE